MSNEKTNIEHLRAIINEKMFDKDEALEFLEAIEEEMENNDTITDLQDQLDKAETKIYELEDELNEEPEPDNIIDCGIGTIEWEADNVQLQLLMENLEERIKEHGALKTLRMLQIKTPA